MPLCFDSRIFSAQLFTEESAQLKGDVSVKRSGMVVFVFVFLLALPLHALAVEVNIRNDEQSSARIALAYLQGDKFVVEGWFTVASGKFETVILHGVNESDVYIYVAFEDPNITQFIASDWKVECLVPDSDFRYGLESIGGTWEPTGANMRKVPFQNIPKLYKTKKDTLWFSLSTAAG